MTEKTSGGTLVSSHTYSYDPDGNTTQDIEQLMSADDNNSYLNHTLGYTYDPMGQVATVTTDGTTTESLHPRRGQQRHRPDHQRHYH